MEIITDRTVKSLLDPNQREELFFSLRNMMIELSRDLFLEFGELDSSVSRLKSPVLFSRKRKTNAPLFIVIGSQHNEHNGLFAMLEFLSSERMDILNKWMDATGGGFCFVPIFNVQGFIKFRL